MNSTVIRDLLANKRLWIGPDYGGAAILGDSTYGGTEQDVLNMEYYFETGDDSTFDWICRASGNPGETRAQREQFFAPYIFYNFVPDNLGEVCRSATDDELRHPDNKPRLIEVLRTQSVQAVWIIGTTQAKYSSPIVRDIVGQQRCVESPHPSWYMRSGRPVDTKDYRRFSKLVAANSNNCLVDNVNGIDIYQVQQGGTIGYRIDQKRFKFSLWLTLDGCRAYAKQLARQKRRQH
jgi:hypothetical protein